MTTEVDENTVAFRKLQGFAKKVAAELRESGRPVEHVKVDGGALEGWRVWQVDALVKTEYGKDGYVGWRTAHVEWDSVWLDTAGTLHRVWIRLDERDSNLAPRLEPERNTRTSASAWDLSMEDALAISGFPLWREKRWRRDGIEHFEGKRPSPRARPGTPPCLGLSKMLSALRSGHESENVILSYG